MELSCVLIDDEEPSLHELREQLRHFCPELKVLRTFQKVDEATSFLKTRAVDTVFLDIEMPERNGFDLLSEFDDPPFQIVFVTGYEHFSFRAIKLNALNYILKPVDPNELKRTCAMLLEMRQKEESIRVMQQSLHFFKQQLFSDQKPKHLTLHHQDGFDIVSIKDIVYLEGDRGYTTLYLKDGNKILVSKTIKVYEDMLREFDFVRIHKSFLVNLHHVKRYLHEGFGGIVTSTGKQLDVSRRRNPLFMEAIEKFRLSAS